MDSMDRRREILNAAQVVFDIKGYAASTVEEIAVRANISKGSIYNYFDSKEDLFAAVFAEALASDHSVVDGIVSSNVSAPQKLQGLLDQVFQRLESFTRSGRLIMELWAVAAKKAELAGAMAQIHAYWRGRIRTVLEDGVRSGEFGTHFDPGVASSLIWATLNGIIVQALFDREAEVGEHSLNSLKRGLLAALTAWSGTSA